MRVEEIESTDSAKEFPRQLIGERNLRLPSDYRTWSSQLHHEASVVVADDIAGRIVSAAIRHGPEWDAQSFGERFDSKTRSAPVSAKTSTMIFPPGPSRISGNTGCCLTAEGTVI